MESADLPDELKPASTTKERTVVRQLLVIRDRGSSFGSFLKLHLFWLTLRYVPAFTLCALLWNEGLKTILPLVVGLTTWLLCLDLIQIRAQARFWHIYEQIIDWNKARKLVEGQ